MKYTATDGTEKQTFEGDNWRVLDKFVEREVFCDVTIFVERIMELSMESTLDEFPEFYEEEFPPLELSVIGKTFEGGDSDDLSNFTEEIEEERDAFIEEHGTRTDTHEVLFTIASHIHQLTNYKKALKQLDEHRDSGRMPEIFCYYSVSNYLADRLKKHGEKVSEYGNHYIWGRGTFGQSITCDGVISRICIDMGIMEGQENSWIDT